MQSGLRHRAHHRTEMATRMTPDTTGPELPYSAVFSINSSITDVRKSNFSSDRKARYVLKRSGACEEGAHRQSEAWRSDIKQ